MKENSVTQKEPLGCSIACVAFIKNVSYKTAKVRYFNKLGDAKKTGYMCKDVVKALNRAGKAYDYVYIKGRQNFKEDSIVFIKRSKRYPKGHYLVKAKKGWMDPWINFNVKKPVLERARSGFRQKLPDRPIYLILPKTAS
jgi:hypothetical protein